MLFTSAILILKIQLRKHDEVAVAMLAGHAVEGSSNGWTVD
jgi:hypothetical protein